MICHHERKDFIWMKPSPKSVSSEWIKLTPKNLKRLTHEHISLLQLEFGFFNYLLIVLSGIVLYEVAMELLGISYIIPILSCDMNLTSNEKGILSGVSLFGVIFSSHLWGYLADTKGRRAVILPTLFVAFILSVCSSFVQNFYLFTVLRFLNGFLWVESNFKN